MANRDTAEFRNVDQYYMNPKENYVIIIKKYEGKDSTKRDILNIYNTHSKALKTISYSKGTFRNFTFDKNEKKTVFLADKSSAKTLIKKFNIYVCDFSSDTANILIDNNHQGIPKKRQVSGDGNLRFDYNTQRLIFGLAPIPSIKDTTLVDFEHAKVDIWHWQDAPLMTQQLVNIKRYLARNYDAIYDFTNKTLTPLIDDTYERVIYVDSIKGNWAIASSVTDKIENQWLGYTSQKLELISLTNGNKKPIIDNFVGQYYFSPTGKYLALFDAQTGNWLSYDTQQGTTQVLNRDIPFSFIDEKNDMPTFAGPYGLAGWTPDDKGIYINDEFDIWYFDLNGTNKHVLTKSVVRNRQIHLRIVNTTKTRQQTPVIDTNRKILLSSWNKKINCVDSSN